VFTLTLDLSQEEHDFLLEVLHQASRNRKRSPVWRATAKRIVEQVDGYDQAVVEDEQGR
jgi:hypothetical protein